MCRIKRFATLPCRKPPSTSKPTPELDRLVELIGIAYDGVGIDTIAQQWGAPIHRRTLQRRLALLVAQQRIEMLGDRRTARYRRRSSAVIHAQ